jgi:general stress protein YciG
MSSAGIDRVMQHLEQTYGRPLTAQESAAWRKEAEEISKQGGDENAVWGQLFTKLNTAHKNTPRGQPVLPSAVGAPPVAGQPMGSAGIDRVMQHLEQTYGRPLTAQESAAWRKEAEEISKKGGDENAVWGELFTKLNTAHKSTPRGQPVLPTAVGAPPVAGEPLPPAALDRVMDHLQQTYGRQFTPAEYLAWRREAVEISKKGGDENAVWGELFTKLNTAHKNVNGG